MVFRTETTRSETCLQPDRYMTGQNSDYPAVNFDASNSSSSANQHVNVQANHKEFGSTAALLLTFLTFRLSLIRQIDQASTVLLKNVRKALPFIAPKTIGIVGNGAGPSSRGPNGYPNRMGDDGVLGMGESIQRYVGIRLSSP